MSYPYPQDRRREQREKGEQPYKDAREVMAEQEADLKAEAEEYGEARAAEGDEERMHRLKAEAEESMREVGVDRQQGRHGVSGGAETSG
jgi:hypothetical protein